MSRHLPILLFLVPFVTAVSLPMVGSKYPAWRRSMTMGAISAMSVLALINLATVLEHGEIRYAFGGWAAPMGIEWVDDALASFVVVTLSVVTLISLIYDGPVSPELRRGKTAAYYTLILLLISALTGVVFSADLFNVFVFIEVAALTGYALVGVAGKRALVSAFRYLILGSFGASLYLLGVSLLYVATGTLNMADLSERLPELMSSTTIVSGLIFVFLGLSIKMALIPLHGWLPDAYCDAPEAISPLLASTITKVALIAWARIMFSVVGPSTDVAHVPVLILLDELAVAAAIAGGVLAVTQRDLKRMFAYGGISHVGLILLGLSLGNATGFAGGIFYLLNDAIMQAALFVLAGAAIHYYGARTVDDLSRVRRRAPWITGALVIVAMSMIGLPPTGGFFGKWNIILGAIEAENYLAVFCVVASTLLTLAYFAKIFGSLFQRAPSPDGLELAEIPELDVPLSLKVSLGAASAAMIALGVLSDPIVGFLFEFALQKGM
jgi:multicomponent Na+:H+ antiporter subunit D